MSEEQGKPKRGFSELRLIVLLTVSLLVIFTIWFLYMAYISNPPGPGKEHPYIATKDDIRNAFYSYAADHNQSFPLFNSTYTNDNCSNCSVINISALLTVNGGLLNGVPDGCYLSTSGNDNCGGNASLGCSTDASYIWIVDNDGNVFSYCAGAGCATNNFGYQDVWP